MAVIFMMSTVTGPAIDKSGLGKEVIQINGHLFLFFLLCIAFYKATKDVVSSMVFTIFYGVLDELHQISTYLRNPSLFDIKIDTIGAVLGGFLLWKLQRLLPKILKSWLQK